MSKVVLTHHSQSPKDVAGGVDNNVSIIYRNKFICIGVVLTLVIICLIYYMFFYKGGFSFNPCSKSLDEDD